MILPNSIQQDVQSSLPILPNNGNPAGAYNMPQQPQPPQPQAAPEDPYAMFKSSPFVEEIQKLLSEYQPTIEMGVANVKTKIDEEQPTMSQPVLPRMNYGMVG